MSGFIRGSQPQTLTRDQAKAVIMCRFIAEQEIAEIFACQDPFESADECPGHLAGHYPVRSGPDVVCAHDGCGKVFDRVFR